MPCCQRYHHRVHFLFFASFFTPFARRILILDPLNLASLEVRQLWPNSPLSSLRASRATAASFSRSIHAIFNQLTTTTALSSAISPRDSYVSCSRRSLTPQLAPPHRPASSIPTADTPVHLAFRPSNISLRVPETFGNTSSV